ncbi:uncharacterized protein LOC109858690 [Pseudomyrmex gracilis]|uniref:uncharacterized protein LOC109858690 n=1 Tax=Pseudomyrmex gracilis TaxID=219809 RepID=UPI00099552C9|nr:uncharacterized protein LOC109858690 [Pseudomyrmex gracilis]
MPHLQGFCNLEKPICFKKIKELLYHTIHIEKANGSDEQNQTYCKKSNMFFEKGVPQNQGRRNDLQAVVDTISTGERHIEAIASKHPTTFIKYHRGIIAYLSITNPIPPRSYKTDVYYYWGPPGSGKSRRALEEATATAPDSIYYKPRGDWWDGYQQQTCVIIDDFYGWIKYDELLKICDRYPYKVPIKGGYEEFTTRKIWITSNIDTDKLYKFKNFIPNAFERQITNKIYIA